MSSVQSSRSLVEIALTLAAPPSISGPHTYSVFVGMSKGEADEYLFGVEGDLSLVVGELGLRTTKTIYVMTDLNVQMTDDRARVLVPKLQCLKSAVEEVGQALGPRDTFYVYIGGHIEVENDETSFMNLPGGECLYGNVLASWLKAAASRGGTIVAIVDVCNSTAFLKMPVIYDVKADGSLHHLNGGAREPQGREGQVIVISSTECGQLARTISISEGQYAGWHGFFTWVFFAYLRNQSGPIDTAALFLHLRKQCDWHPEKPRPQVSATATGIRHLPIERPSA